MTEKDNSLVAYSRETVPLVLKVEAAKQALKKFKESDELIQELQQEIKNIKENIKGILEDKAKDLLEELATAKNEVKEAATAAAEANKEYKAKELKSFFTARATEKVKPVIQKGDVFDKLENELSQ